MYKLHASLLLLDRKTLLTSPTLGSEMLKELGTFYEYDVGTGKRGNRPLAHLLAMNSTRWLFHHCSEN